MLGFFHMLTLQNSFPPAVTTHSLCYQNCKWKRNYADIQVDGRNYCKLLWYNDNGGKVFPGSSIFLPEKFAKMLLQSMFLNKIQMF